jgi:hypothetical protein
MAEQASFLIIGGVEKAGTTSLYTYLAAHPQVLPSLRKETDYFRTEGATREAYVAEFPPLPAAGGPWTMMESSPGYLAEADRVAPRLAAALPQARLVFVLREPIERLRSCYRFYRSRLYLPEAMSFDTFVRTCLQFEETGHPPGPGLMIWHLRALSRGRYERQLVPFLELFPQDQVLVLDYEALRRDARALTARAAGFAGLDDGFYAQYGFERENVSFGARHRGLQRAALAVNHRLERLWRRHPALKRRLLRIYKRLNEKPLESDPLSPETMSMLQAWYGPTRQWLAARFSPAAAAAYGGEGAARATQSRPALD